jgi:futalosine hydrolase
MPMRVLVVAATVEEITPLGLVVRHAHHERPTLSLSQLRGDRRHDVDVLLTGVGMVAAAARTASALARTRYELALNLGLCGSFDPALPPGTVVHVVSDRLPELGAEDGDAFLTIQELGLFDDDAAPFSGGRLVNSSPPMNPVLQKLPAVHGISVSTVHGNERSIAETVRRFAPHVESMEGAGFMYACLIQNVPFAQVRSVSNVVERRDRSTWKVDEAVASLCRVATDVLDAA